MFSRGAKIRALFCGVCLLLGAMSQAYAQGAGWKPEKTVELVAPAGLGGLHDLTARSIQRVWQTRKLLDLNSVVVDKGGASDTMVRIIGARLSEKLRQPVVIDNRPGAGGNIAAEIVARSSPDGYTLLLRNNGMLAVNVRLYPKIGFDPVQDFAPVVLVALQPNILVVHPSVPALAVKDLVALAKSKPGQLNYAVPGSGTTGHLAAELFKRLVNGKLFFLIRQATKGRGRDHSRVTSHAFRNSEEER